MSLCKLCLSIPFGSLPSIQDYETWGQVGQKYLHAFVLSSDNVEKTITAGILHQPTLESLKSSAKDCKLCRLILKDVESVIAQIEACTASSHKEKTNPWLYTLRFRFSLVQKGQEDDGFWVLSSTNSLDTFQLVAAFQFCASDGSYITLSHCWGSSKQLTTTRSTLAARISGITFDELPKTFQDAVLLSRILKISYLWIDSLCICQDDEEDWERESAKMATVYASSYLTVAAIAATNSADGLFALRIPPQFVEIKYTFANGTIGRALAFAVPIWREVNPQKYTHLSHEPLSSRAWALQERALARRTLHYGNNQMYFECSTRFEAEDGFRFTGHYYPVLRRFRKEINDKSNQAMMDYWQDLIRAYSSRKLTKASDKLPAISGLAELMQEAFINQEYLAGLWSGSLVEQLCWFTDENTLRIPELRAPSWSWASCDGKITHFNLKKDCPAIAEIIGHQVKPKGASRYGQVISGWIKIKAPLIPLYFSEENDPYRLDVCYANQPFALDTRPLLKTDNGLCKNTPLFDGLCRYRASLAMEELKKHFIRSYIGLEIFALVVGIIDNRDDKIHYLSLIVTPVEKLYTMKRLGIITASESILGGQTMLESPAERLVVTLV
ncbi:heterokaryon incompatibility protein-domain-containing protein [Bisporella sp. PMI_857]|nr:heterokaryon incompatibility protein-domain-containing protein [Bisporella sp. PMI_857]